MTRTNGYEPSFGTATEAQMTTIDLLCADTARQPTRSG